jgi:integrase
MATTRRLRIPAYQLHKASGQAKIRVRGRDIYLGVFDSVASRKRYGDLIGQLAATGDIPTELVSKDQRKQPTEHTSPLVSELILAFMRHAATHYVKNGRPTAEVHCIRSAIRPLNELFGRTPVVEFTPRQVLAVRNRMLELDYSRKFINQSVNRIRHIFKKGVEWGIVPVTVWQALQCVSPLLAGRTTARETPGRKPANPEHVELVKQNVNQRTRDMIDLQSLCGCRPGEVVSLTTSMIDTSGDVWVAHLTDHKCVHLGLPRTLVFGPKAQLILRRYLNSSEPDRRLFNLSRHSYSKNIVMTCDKLEIPRWTPHCLRHNAATSIREEFGVEAAQAVLGHSKVEMTEHYAKQTLTRAINVAAKVG